MALKCSVRDLGVKRIISSPIEHHCVLHSLERLQKTMDVEVKLLPVNEFGRLDMTVLKEWLADSEKKTLVSLMHSNNEIGTMIDIDLVADICQNHHAYFHTDTVQTIGYYPVDVSHEKISFLSGSAHKFHGPKGIGFIYINNENIVNPFVDGGSQERNMRGGTENIVGIAGLAKALQYSINHMEDHKTQISELKSYLKERLESEFSDIQFMGDDQGLFVLVFITNE